MKGDVSSSAESMSAWQPKLVQQPASSSSAAVISTCLLMQVLHEARGPPCPSHPSPRHPSEALTTNVIAVPAKLNFFISPFRRGRCLPPATSITTMCSCPSASPPPVRLRRCFPPRLFRERPRSRSHHRPALALSSSPYRDA